MSYIKENFDIIIKDTSSNLSFIKDIKNLYYKEYKISETKADENNLQTQINDILDKIESKYIYSEKILIKLILLILTKILILRLLKATN